MTTSREKKSFCRSVNQFKKHQIQICQHWDLINIVHINNAYPIFEWKAWLLLLPYTIRSYLGIPSCLLIGQMEWSKRPRYTAWVLHFEMCVSNAVRRSGLSGQDILLENNTLKCVYQMLPSDWPICLVLNYGLTGQGSSYMTEMSKRPKLYCRV